MPIGFLITLGLVALGMAVSLSPPARSGLGGLVTWLISAIPNESPFLALYWLAAFTGREYGSGLVSPPHRSPGHLSSCAEVCAQPQRSRRRWIEVSDQGGDTQALASQSQQIPRGPGSCLRRYPSSIPV